MTKVIKKIKEKAEKPVKVSKKTEVIVYNNESPVRAYTLEAHGKDFAKLAEQFALKNNFSIK